MSIAVVWDNETQDILRWFFDDQWNWDEYHKARHQSNAMVKRVQHRVDAIWDVRTSKPVPANAFASVNSERPELPEGVGLIVIVGSSAFFKVLAHLFGRLSHHIDGKIAIADSPDDAYQLIAQARG